SLRKQWAIDHLTLLGYSWGGLLAVLYALEHPERVGRLTLVAPAPLTAQWREQFDRRLAARMADPWIARARAELTASGLAQRDPEKYRRLPFALSVAGYFRDPSRAREMTPLPVPARTQQAVWQSLGDYRLRARLKTIIARLEQAYPDATCALDHRNPLELLVATILSAQSTDARVNMVTPALFTKYRTARDYAAADPTLFEQEIHSTGFFR